MKFGKLFSDRTIGRTYIDVSIKSRNITIELSNVDNANDANNNNNNNNNIYYYYYYYYYNYYYHHLYSAHIQSLRRFTIK